MVPPPPVIVLLDGPVISRAHKITLVKQTAVLLELKMLALFVSESALTVKTPI